MAEVVFIEHNVSNIIVGVHYQEINENTLPSNHAIIEAEVEEPEGLVGLNISLITEGLDKRPSTELSQQDILRSELKTLSIELDLMERLSEDTTAKQAEFDTKKAQYEAL